MAWGTPRESRNKLYEADYNRAYDTHTPAPTSREFEVSRVNVADAPPVDTPAARGYQNPLTTVVQLDGPHGIGPREIQTGNAPSGGYVTDPGKGFASRLNGTEYPDNRRTLEYRPSDWESSQVGLNYVRDADRRARRAETTVEDFDHLETEGRFGSVDRTAKAAYSPYSVTYGEGGRMTSGTNPNRWRFWREWGTSDGLHRDAGSRYLTGEHYSMASHHTLNPYGPQEDGMAPVNQLRNTFRLDPQPWDAGLNDAPTNVANYATRIGRESVGDVTGLGQSYRL